MKIAISCVITEQTAGPAVVARAAESLGFEGLFIPNTPVIPVVHWTRYPDVRGRIRFPAIKSYPKPMQKPHSPIHIGSNVFRPSCERALKNVVAFGEGWMPYGISPERLDRELATLKRLCADTRRDFRTLETTAYPPPNQLAKCGGDHRRMIEEYRAAGAHRIVLGSATLEPAKVERALENLARKLLV